MFEEDQIKQILDTLDSLNSRTRIYFGCDSIRKWKGKNWHATYATIVAIHKNANSGCALFYYTSNEIDYDNNASKPRMRLMNEAYKVCEAYLQLQPFISKYKSLNFISRQQDLKVALMFCRRSWREKYLLRFWRQMQSRQLQPESHLPSWLAGRQTSYRAC